MITKEQLTQIATYILQGLSEDESCIICDINPSNLRTLKEQSEDVRNFLQKQHITFKLAHLKEIQTKKSEKNSQWLLEKLRPEEFGTRQKNQGDQTINIIGQIIKNIQDNDDTSKIAPTNRGEMVIKEAEIFDIQNALK